MKAIKLILALHIILSLNNVLFSQAGTIDNEFLIGTGGNESVREMQLQNDGKIVIVGGFNSFNGSNLTGITRLNTDGTLDMSFNTGGTGPNGAIEDVALQADGKIVIVGGFNSYNGSSINGIARLNTDGTLDPTFNPGPGADNSIRTVSIQTDGKIIIAGDFSAFNSISRRRVARVNPDGILDTSFGTEFAGPNGTVLESTIQNDGRVLIGGYFTNYAGSSANYLVRLNTDGTLDNTFSITGIGAGGINQIKAITVQDDGRILIGGIFSSYNGVNIKNLARINSDASLDQSFNPQGVGANSDIETILIQNDFRIIIGGKFWTYNLTPINRIARVEFDGTLDNSFNPGEGALGTVLCSAFQPDGKLLLGGYFTAYNNVSANNVTRLHMDTGYFGVVYADINENCVREDQEVGIANRTIILNPGNIVTQTNAAGVWYLNSIPNGNYTLTFDTLGDWNPTCANPQNITVQNVNGLSLLSSFGYISDSPCSDPIVSIHMPFMRPCFGNQKIYINSCNKNFASGPLVDAYTDVQLDQLLTLQSASISYEDLGNNLYRFIHGTLFPGDCQNFTINAMVNCDAEMGRTLCLEANMYPREACNVDTILAPVFPDGVTPCLLPWDHSSLSVDGWCANDSIYFTITNTGQFGGGDMDCYSPVRLYIDGVLFMFDSIKLLGGETFTYAFLGTGQTWILQTDQHPLHPGNSHPNAHVENCNPGNWTPDLVNDFPQDDAEAVKDIYCGIVTVSCDPNDKRGFPSGVGENHEILPNQDLEYIIRFQNTGNDTAFTVVVRDTLDVNFDIFSVSTGTSSHSYTFRMYGPRVLEWTFSNILLPDSTTNEPLSNGFLTFTVKQVPNLTDGTLLTNDADIYFDFNAPIITNETSHKVQRRKLDATNALDQISKVETGIKIYPNPTKEEATLSFSTYQKQVAYKLIDISGQIVLEKSNLYGKALKLNLSDVPNGIYFMEVTTDRGSEVLKVVKE